MNKRTPKNKVEVAEYETGNDPCFARLFDINDEACTGLRLVGITTKVIHYGCAVQHICSAICHSKEKAVALKKLKEDKGLMIDELRFDKIDEEGLIGYVKSKNGIEAEKVLEIMCKNLDVVKQSRKQLVYLHLMTILIKHDFNIIDKKIYYNGI